MIVATELTANRGIADILAVTKNMEITYEVEVKVSLNDFKKDFKDKAHKHKFIQRQDKSCPNFFYFCCPQELEEKILENLPETYGLMVCDKNQHIYVSKKAKKTKTGHLFNNNYYSDIVMRISSELVVRCEQIVQMKKKCRECYGNKENQD